MKAQSKAIVASLVVLALAVCAVSGATYSWFSDTEETEISITSGAIDLEMTECTVESYIHVGTDIAANKSAPGVNVDMSSDAIPVTVSGMVPGDVLTLEFTGTLVNTIDAVLLFNTDVTVPGGLESPFTIANSYMVGEVDYDGVVEANYSEQGVGVTSTVTITMKNVGNEYNGKTFIIGLNFSAYQANTPSSDLPADTIANSVTQEIPASIGTNIGVPTAPSAALDNVSVTLGQLDESKTVTVSSITGTASKDASYIVEMTEFGGTVIGGVDVSGIDSTGTPSFISFTLDGEYTAAELAIFHEGVPLSYTDSTPGNPGYYTLSVSEGVTTVIICANEFSAYYAVEVDGVAFVSDVASFETAMELGGVDTIVLTKDIEGASMMTVATDATLDLNGKVISGVCNTGQAYMFMVNNGVSLTVKDSVGGGKITFASGSSNVGWTIDLEGNLILESGTIELTGSWSIGYAVDVRPNAWGTAYTSPTVFTMNGGSIISSDAAVRVASSSSETYTGVSASFVMNDGVIEAVWDGVFIQQSDAIYDVLSFTMTGGTIESGLAPIRFYGPVATSTIGDERMPMTLVLSGGSLLLTTEFDSIKTWFVDEKILLGDKMTVSVLEEYLKYTLPSDYAVNQSNQTSNT